MIYPPRCAMCNEVLGLGETGVCGKCLGLIPYVNNPYCMKCGKPLTDEKKEYCDDCTNKVHYYDEGRAALVYDENMSKSIYRFKYNAKQEYARYYGKVIYDRLGDKIRSWRADALIPVPIHKSKYKKRGYNQAYLIAKELSKYLKIPVNEQILARRKSTKMQKNLTARERENNLKKAFIVSRNVVELKSVIIIDDIYTTGSTVDAIAKALKSAGVEKVYFISLCIGRGI